MQTLQKLGVKSLWPDPNANGQWTVSVPASNAGNFSAIPGANVPNFSALSIVRGVGDESVPLRTIGGAAVGASWQTPYFKVLDPATRAPLPSGDLEEAIFSPSP